MRSQTKRINKRKQEQVKALFFCLSLIAFMIGGIGISIGSSGPVVLGTEMNTNGQVEYLCLFGGCDQLTDMKWNDKR